MVIEAKNPVFHINDVISYSYASGTGRNAREPDFSRIAEAHVTPCTVQGEAMGQAVLYKRAYQFVYLVYGSNTKHFKQSLEQLGTQYL